MLGDLAAIEAATGDRPTACPWWSFHDDDVRAVLHAYDYFESGQLAWKTGDDPPYWLVEGVTHYHRVLARVRAASKEQGPPPAQPPTGNVVRRDRG